jgi:hypothetical protein
LPTLVVELRGLLREELGRVAPLSPRARRLAALAAVALLLGGAWWWVRASDDGISVVAKGPPTFNFRHPDALRSVPPHGEELVRFEQRRKSGRLLAAFAVEPLAVPAHDGRAARAMPALAARELAALRRRFPALRLAHGETIELNEVAGYTMSFRASRRPRLLGRVVLLPEPVPGSPRGVRLLMLARPGDGVGSADDVGLHGPTKLPYRSFRFGTETS